MGVVLTDEIFSHMVYPPSEHRTIAAVEGMADPNDGLLDVVGRIFGNRKARLGSGQQSDGARVPEL